MTNVQKLARIIAALAKLTPVESEDVNYHKKVQALSAIHTDAIKLAREAT